MERWEMGMGERTRATRARGERGGVSERSDDRRGRDWKEHKHDIEREIREERREIAEGDSGRGNREPTSLQWRQHSRPMN